jgi:apolipoprotein N-acyltransferase
LIRLSEFRPWRLRIRTGALRSWRISLVLFLAGALSSLAMAPLHAWPALAIGLITLFWSLEGVHRRTHPVSSGFWRGFVFGMGYFLAGTFWLGFAFINRGPEFIPLIPLALPILAAILAAYWGFATLVYVLIGHRSVWRVLVFAAVLVVFEWLRGHLFSGLPWNLPAYAWPAGGAVSQAASWFGVYGLSFLTVFVFTAPAVLFCRSDPLRRAMPALTGLAIFLVLLTAGAYRLSSTESLDQAGVRIRIVHMAITQAEKWADDGPERARDRYLEVTAAPGLGSVTHVVWPEGALPSFMLEDGATLGRIGNVLADGPVLMSGVTRRELAEDDSVRYYNALAVLRFPNGAPRLEALYDKARLVPFSETIPFAWALDLIGYSEFARYQFDAGHGPRVLDLDGLPPMMPLICYEAVFPGFVAAAPSRPAWLFNLSNDAWFGPTSGPQQHLIQARYRSIEHGLPMVRSASRGISGVIDPLGRMPLRIEREAEGAYDAALPRPLEMTPYARWGNMPFWMLCLSIMAGSLWQKWRRRRVTGTFPV